MRLCTAWSAAGGRASGGIGIVAGGFMLKVALLSIVCSALRLLKCTLVVVFAPPSSHGVAV